MKIKASIFGLCVLGVQSSTLEAVAPLARPEPLGVSSAMCYVPGAGGGRDVMMKEVPVLMRKRGVPYYALETGKTGSVQERAVHMVQELSALLRLDPALRCHAFGNSMGGVILRYALNHLSIETPDEGQRPFRERVLSLTTLSTPHSGTPLGDIPGTGFIDSGLEQMGEEGIAIFNDPRQPETYSPPLPGFQNFSYATWAPKVSDCDSVHKAVGWKWIRESMGGRGLDPRNDCVVPLASQPFGHLIQTLPVNHSALSGGIRSSKVLDFYQEHWRRLTGEKGVVSGWGIIPESILQGRH